MSLIFDNCIEFHDNRKICVATQRGKKYVLNNISGLTIRKVVVDGCLLQNGNEKRCDYLMSFENVMRRVIFIELKGGSLTDALKQVYSTILYLKDEFKNYRFDARIIGSRDVPGFINTPDYRKLAREVKPFGTIIRATNNFYSENV
jgi:hypothetical protein